MKKVRGLNLAVTFALMFALALGACASGETQSSAKSAETEDTETENETEISRLWGSIGYEEDDENTPEIIRVLSALSETDFSSAARYEDGSVENGAGKMKFEVMYAGGAFALK